MDVSELEFCQSVEENLKECDGYIEAVIEACIRHNIDIRAGAKLISQPIIEKIQNFGKSFDQLTTETVKAFLIDSKNLILKSSRIGCGGRI